MSVSKYVLPGYYKLDSVFIVSYETGKKLEVSKFVTSFSIEESIDTDSVRGVISFHDTLGILENFPIRGEELIILNIEDALKIKKKYEFNIYRVSNVNPTDKNDAVTYEAFFTSKWRYQAGIRRITRSFENIISQTARFIFDTYYPRGKELIVEETDGVFKCLIPNYTPMQAMNFLASRAYSQTSPSCSFRFFENDDNFFFVSDEFLIKRGIANEEEIKEFIFSDALNKSGTDFYAQMKNLKTLENTDRLNTMTDLYSGAYTSNVIEIDIVKRIVQNKKYVYENNKYTAMSENDARPVHSDSFINDYFTEENARRYILVKDYASIGDIPSNIRGEQYLSEIVTNRVAYRRHLNNTIVHVTAPGRLDIKAGDVIALKIPSFTTGINKELRNNQLSGNYLINDCKHSFMRETYETAMKLVKYDWSSR
jgi:hypothetical protein